MFIIEDEGFSIPSEKACAANARVCARALLQWTRDNEKPAEEFSGKLVASLKACFHKSKSVRVQEKEVLREAVQVSLLCRLPGLLEDLPQEQHTEEAKPHFLPGSH